MKKLIYPGYTIHEPDPKFSAKHGMMFGWIEALADDQTISNPMFRASYELTDEHSLDLDRRKVEQNRDDAWHGLIALIVKSNKEFAVQ